MKKDPFAVQIGQNILNLRKKDGMTQAQLAEKINVSTTFISRVERGEKFVSSEEYVAWIEEVLRACEKYPQT